VKRGERDVDGKERGGEKWSASFEGVVKNKGAIFPK